MGGRPRLLSRGDEDVVVAAATTRPPKLGQPLTRWSIRKLATCLRNVHGHVIRIGRAPRIRYFHGRSSVGDDTLWGVNRRKRGAMSTLAARSGPSAPAAGTAIANSNHHNHTVQTRAWHAYLR